MASKASQLPVGGRNRQSMETAIKALSDRISDDLSALVEMCRSLADAVDDQPGSAGLWAEYRRAQEALMAATKSEGDGNVDQFIARLSA